MFIVYVFKQGQRERPSVRPSSLQVFDLAEKRKHYGPTDGEALLQSRFGATKNHIGLPVPNSRRQDANLGKDDDIAGKDDAISENTLFQKG